MDFTYHRRVFRFVIEELQVKFGITPLHQQQFQQLGDCEWCGEQCVEVRQLGEGWVAPNDVACLRCFSFVTQYNDVQ